MLKSLRNFAVLVVLLVVPLQGVAAALTTALCSSVPAQVQSADGHDHNDNAAGPNEHDGSTDTTYSGHLCCHHYFAAVPVIAADIGSAESPSFDLRHRYSAWLFFPEQPQPVPLA